MRTCTLLSLLVFYLCAASNAAAADSGRERISLDRGWRFALGHAADPDRDFGH
jgi:beta-galactosidase